MKEQDFIQKIEEKAKDLPIPNSVSPQAMKDLLDIATPYKENKETTKKTENTASNRRLIKRLTLAACFVLCFTGCIYGAKLITVHTDKKGDSTETTKPVHQPDAAKEPEEEPVYQTYLKNPKTYQEYYNTLKKAYDDYYEKLADVKSSDDLVFDYVEEKGTSGMRGDAIMEESVMEDSATNTSSQKQFSSTNTQEATVDEGDIVKTDGSYIYKVMTIYNPETGYDENKLTITKANNGELTSMSTINLNEVLKTGENEYADFREFYLQDDKLYLMFSKENYEDSSLPVTATYIVIYDLSDKENPKKVKTLSQSGWYESSRISDGYLYTISNFCETSLEDETKLNQYIPSINNRPIACDRIYYPPNILMDTTHVVTSLNLENPEDFTDSKAIPSNGNQYYVSDSSIYFYTTRYENLTKTEIMKLNYEDGVITVGNSAVVTGYLYDSFALNEYNGYLRIVATIPASNFSLLRSFDMAVESVVSADTSVVTENVNVLYILDKDMNLTGKIAGIAPGETIQSARFMGDTGYFVTFRNMDPLFSVDLSDPANPEIIGSLKIPGFSNYLHFYTDDLMLGIGQEVDPKTQEWLGLKLSMFNISDPADVTEQDKYIIENSMMSEALYNHKAIMIDPQKNIFGFLYGTNSSYDYNYYYATYTYTDEGFIETAKYRVNDESAYGDNTRGIYIDDYFYLTTKNSVTSYKLGTEEKIATVNY